MQGIFRKENTDKALKYGIYRHLPTYEKIIRNLVSFYLLKNNCHKTFLNKLLTACSDTQHSKKEQEIPAPFFADTYTIYASAASSASASSYFSRMKF